MNGGGCTMRANNKMFNRIILVFLICVLGGCNNNYIKYDAHSKTIEADDVILFLELDIKDSCNKEYVYHIIKKRGKRGTKHLCFDSIHADYGVFLCSIDSVQFGNRLSPVFGDKYIVDYDYPVVGVEVHNKLDLSIGMHYSIKNYSYGDATSYEITN